MILSPDFLNTQLLMDLSALLAFCAISNLEHVNSKKGQRRDLITLPKWLCPEGVFDIVPVLIADSRAIFHCKHVGVAHVVRVFSFVTLEQIGI